MTSLGFKAVAALAPRKVNIVQGEHFVTDDEGVTLTTILGSCVAACLFDERRGVGGMNHFLLAESGGGEAAMRYGAYAMEVLINDLMKRGAARERLQAKVFGGAKMMTGFNDIGAGNAVFVRRFLSDEGIPITAESLGGFGARRVEFNPVGGRVRVREADPDQVRVAERRAPEPVADGGVELF